MSLFEVKGWDVPSKAVATTSPSQSTSRKRKRPANDDRIQSAQVNLEKLMRKVEKGGLESAQDKKPKNKGKGRGKRHGDDPDSMVDRVGAKPRDNASKPRHKSMNDGPAWTRSSEETKDPTDAPTRPSKRARKKGSQNLSATSSQQPTMLHKPSGSVPTKKAGGKTNASDGLTSLQSSMKGSLDGARFRWINEILYTTGSGEGHNLMREEPKLYEEYHIGFRQQVRSWPSNPISHYITELSSYPQGTVIADLGCGDAALARSLIQKGYCVLSYDLVSDNAFVVEADVCERIPLPGSEDFQADGGQGQIVDVCICALSLMSLDWIKGIREAWRILRLGGELKIAEVTSRFTDVDQFIFIITSIGFKFKLKDDSNTHFTLFEFEKVTREPLNEEDWENLREKHIVLKPCEYKRRIAFRGCPRNN